MLARRRGLECGLNDRGDVELVGGLVGGQHQQALAILAELVERDRAGERVLAPKLHRGEVVKRQLVGVGANAHQAARLGDCGRRAHHLADFLSL